MSVTPLITTEWLAEQMKTAEWKTKYRLLDATWDLAVSKRNFVEEHTNCRISGAKYFSLAECQNKEAKLPNTVPIASYFEDYVSGLGVSNEHHIILYDNSEKFGLFSAPRAWWLFNLFGHDKVSILDGGLPKWKKDGFATTSGSYSGDEKFEAPATKFKANFKPELVKDLAFMKANLESSEPYQVVDARPSGRFRGIAPEPRPDIPSGHIPKAFNVPFFDNYDREKNVLLSADGIKEHLKKCNVDVEGPMVASCGSGISACDLSFAIYVATGKMIPLFDDSWFGWQTNTTDDLQIREKKE